MRQGDIPDKVFALMQTSNIFEEEVRKVFSGKGYYPEDTPWSILEAEGFVGWVDHPPVGQHRGDGAPGSTIAILIGGYKYERIHQRCPRNWVG